MLSQSVLGALTEDELKRYATLDDGAASYLAKIAIHNPSAQSIIDDLEDEASYYEDRICQLEGIIESLEAIDVDELRSLLGWAIKLLSAKRLSAADKESLVRQLEKFKALI